MDCGERLDTGGDCAACGKGPLLDLRDPEVRRTLVEDDDRRARKREGLVIGAAVLVAIPAVVGLELAIPLLARVLYAFGCLGELGACAALAVALWQLGRRLWPARRRFPYLRSP